MVKLKINYLSIVDDVRWSAKSKREDDGQIIAQSKYC